MITVLVVVLVSACTPAVRKAGRKEGCASVEEKLAYYMEREVRKRRFKVDIKYRVVLVPISLTVGFFANYFMQAIFILPVLAPEGFPLEDYQIEALGLGRALTYRHLQGSRLDKVDDSAIAFVTYEVGMCYYEEGNYAQASTFFESLLGTNYAYYVGEDNLLYPLGKCYYNLEEYDAALANYRRFMKVAPKLDTRRRAVTRSIRNIEAMQQKKLWGMGKGDKE